MVPGDKMKATIKVKHSTSIVSAGLMKILLLTGLINALTALQKHHENNLGGDADMEAIDDLEDDDYSEDIPFEVTPKNKWI